MTRLGLGSVVGYLLAGVAIGPSALQLVSRPEDVLHFAELGVVFLLFIIGLELNPRKLWSLRKSIFGTGLAQVLLAIGVFCGLASWSGQAFNYSLVAAMGFALSSTAVAVQVIKERSWLGTHFGQSSFSVLLFQDLAVIPMLLILPLLGSVSQTTDSNESALLVFGKSIFAIILIVLLGRFVLRHVFRLVASTGLKEVFTALILLLVIGIASVMAAVGLSMAFGSFLAGVLLADSEYRHEIEIDIEPFKGLLLGLFFISVGMSTDLAVLFKTPLEVFALLGVLVFGKLIMNLLVAQLAGLKWQDSLLFSVLLAQGGEFAFVLFSSSAQVGILSSEQLAVLNVSVALSLMTTPLLLLGAEWYLARSAGLAGGKGEFDQVENENARVIIAGYGRFGQMVGRILHSMGVSITVLDSDPNQIEIVRSFGWKAFYGDATRLDLLESAGIATAQVLVVAVDDMSAAETIVTQVQQKCPQMRILVRSRNRAFTYRFMNMGVEVVRELALSSVEMAERTLVALGYTSYDAFRLSRRFYKYDKKMIERAAPLFEDQKALVSYAAKSREELAKIMQADEKIEESSSLQWH